MVSNVGNPPVEAYQSASELRGAHGRLLERLDGLLEADGSPERELGALAELEGEVDDFLARAAATGIFIEDVRERTACQILLDYWVSSLTSAGRQRPTARLERFDGERLPDLKDKLCPYVGLEAFRDKTYFFGRETDTLALLEQVLANRLVVVSGASGTGKSSLVMGGLLPRLAAHEAAARWRVLPPRVPRDFVLENFVDPAAGPVMLTIDQFEEVFTLATPSARQALAEGLAQLLTQQSDSRVILTVREEFRSQMAGLRPLEPFFQNAWYSMRPMSYEELRAAVEKPAAMVNLQFQPGIVDDLVKKVLGQPAALPLLQFTLRALWEARDRNRITREVYDRVGDPLSALQTSANAFYRGLTPEDQEEARRILLELVRVDELLEAYRQPVPKSLLLEAGKASTVAVLERLAEHDFVRITSDSSGGEAIVEVKHEALIRNWPLFVGWIDEKRILRRQRLALTQAAEVWAANDKPEDEGLLGGWQLEEAKRQQGLSVLECEYVEASAAATEKAQREKEAALQAEAAKARALAARERKLRWQAVGFAVFALTVAIYLAVRFRDLEGEIERSEDQLTAIQMNMSELRDAFDKLQEERDVLQKERDSMFAKIASDSLIKPNERSLSLPRTIYLHISTAAQLRRVQQIAMNLESNGIKVPEIECVQRELRVSEVRYFHKEDAAVAEWIAELVAKYLEVETAVEPTRVRGLAAPLRQLEIWFAPGAFGVTAAQESAQTHLPEQIALLGDPDAAVRQCAAAGLRSLTDRGSQLAAIELLFTRLESPDNSNAVYNAVAVLCALRQQMPEQRERIDQGLTEVRSRLEADPRPWTQTLVGISTCLAGEE